MKLTVLLFLIHDYVMYIRTNTISTEDLHGMARSLVADEGDGRLQTWWVAAVVESRQGEVLQLRGSVGWGNNP
jgi:hypothetical protein